MKIPLKCATATSSTTDKSTTDKKPWTTPVIEAVNLSAAAGPHRGSKSDKHGSLSGTGA